MLIIRTHSYHYTTLLVSSTVIYHEGSILCSQHTTS